MWCSTTTEYDGHWKQCIDPCKNKWPVKKIASTVVAGSVAATGIGLIAAAVANKKHGGDFNPFAPNGPVGEKKPTPAPAATATAAPIATTTEHVLVVKAAVPPHDGLPGQVGIDEVILPATEANKIAVGAVTTTAWSGVGPGGSLAQQGTLEGGAPRLLKDAPARDLNAFSNFGNMFLGKPSFKAGVSTSIVPVEVDVPVKVYVEGNTTMGPKEATQRLWLLLFVVGICVCCCGCICSIGAAHYGGFGKKRKRRGAPPAAAEPGYPAAYEEGRTFE